jgi:hypothetical protein
MNVVQKLREVLREGTCAYFVMFVILANLPMWAEGMLGKLEYAGWFNLDFIAVGVLALFLPRAVSAVLLLMAMVADSMAAICLTYYINPSEILTNALSVEAMPGRRIVIQCAMVVLSIAVVGALWALPRPKRRFRTAVLLILFALASEAGNQWVVYRKYPSAIRMVLHGGMPPIESAAALSNEKPARTGAVRLMHASRLNDLIDDLAESDEGVSGPAQSAAAGAYRALTSISEKAGSQPDFVLVLVESWGESTDPAIRRALVQPYDTELGNRFTIVQGTVPFHGPTISGEDRELCGNAGGASIMHAPASDLRDCLPERLREKGFATIAVHGMLGRFYHRNEWYPRMGFQEIWFGPQLSSMGLPDCVGAFTGTCDSAIADWIGERLAQPDSHPRFVYWVTLGSHLPVPDPPPLRVLVPCDATTRLADNLALCNWYRLVRNVHQSVASLANRNTGRPAVYVIVGDHAPPFSETDLRSGFDQERVPYVILLPKTPLRENLASSRTAEASKPLSHHGG